MSLVAEGLASKRENDWMRSEIRQLARDAAKTIPKIGSAALSRCWDVPHSTSVIDFDAHSIRLSTLRLQN